MRFLIFLFAVGLVAAIAPTAFAQTYGVELHNTLMPASSGMGGTSFTQPQDIQSAIYGNPATMTQFAGNSGRV